MTDRIVDNRGGTCEQCGGEYQSLSQHWSRNQRCEYPSWSDHQREVIRGLLLGDGTLGGDDHAYLRCASRRKEHLKWCCEQLGWLCRGITLDSRETYRLLVMSHPNFGRYWTWVEAPSTGYSLTPTAARVWYACDGTLSFGGSSDVPQITFAATHDGKRDATAQLLEQRGFDPLTWERRIALRREQTLPWLNWIGKPTPGSEYKCCTDESEYTRRREEVDVH